MITGADPIPAAAWVQEPEKPIWRHAPWTYRGTTHPNAEFHRVIGRTEQVIVDWENGNYTLRPASPAKRIDAGFTEQPVTLRR